MAVLEEVDEVVAVMRMMVVASAVSEVDDGGVKHRSSIQSEQQKQQRAVHSQHQPAECLTGGHSASAFDICCDRLHKLIVISLARRFKK